MDTFLQDLRFGLRVLAKRPGVTLVAVLTLALGIGANTAIFSVVSAVLLRPVPYPGADRIVMLWERNPKVQIGSDDLPASPGDFAALRDRCRSFEAVSAVAAWSHNLTGQGEPERVGVASVSHTFFDVMGVGPRQGRPFLDREDRPGAGQVAVVSHRLWQRKFGGDPSLVGKAVVIDAKPYTVVGIMPEGFSYPNATDLPSYMGAPEHTDVWVPSALETGDANAFSNRFLAVVGRMRPGVTAEEAQTEASAIAGQVASEHADTNEGTGVRVVPLREQLVGDIRPALLALQAAVAILLLIACANLTNLLLARAAGRGREIAVRMAIGATRARIVRQLLTESLLLALAGGAAGVLLSSYGVGLLATLAPDDLAQAAAARVDGWTLVFTLAVALGTGLVVGLAPALRASRVEIGESLKEGAKDRAGGGRRAFGRATIVAAEVALATVLLACGGLVINSFARLLAIDPGFEPEGVIAATVPLTPANYAEPGQSAAFFDELVRRAGAVPGVDSASVVSDLPLGGSIYAGGFSVQERPEVAAGDAPMADRRMIGPAYFRTMGIRLARGRDFEARDGAEAPGVAIVTESFARRYLPGDDPIGRHVKLGGADSDRPWLEIVGVAGDVHHTALSSDVAPCIYVPYAQRPSGTMTLVARTSGDPARLGPSLVREVREIDPDQPVAAVKPMTAYVAESVAARRFSVALTGGFAAVALLLAAIGIYGVLSYSVGRRTHEIGVRMALGAGTRDVVRMVLGQGLLPVAIGIALGVAGAIAAGRLLASLLFEVSPADPATFAAAAALLAAVALAACILPARRAARVDPMVALRDE